MYNLHKTAERIKALCDTRGVSINKMLTESGAGARTYYNILAGSYPSTDKALKIANYFDCSVDYLLGRTDTPTRPQGSSDIEEEVVVYCRNGKTTRKKLTKEQMEYLDKFINSFGEEDYPDL